MGEATKATTSAATKSWRTTAAGWAAGLAILLHQASVVLDGSGSVSWEAVATGLGLIGVGLFARDNGVSSEQAGAVKP